MFCHISLEGSDTEECDTRHDARELETSNIKYIRDKGYKSDNDKRDKRPECDGERGLLSYFFGFGREIRTDRHRCSVSEEIGKSENDNDFTREISTSSTGYNSKSRDRPIDSSVNHLREIVSK